MSLPLNLALFAVAAGAIWWAGTRLERLTDAIARRTGLGNAFAGLLLLHPYIRRKNGLEEPVYGHALMRPALEKTLGVPLFQEQMMQLAIDCAGFSPSEADQLRRAMGSKRSGERMERLKGRLYEGMAANGIPPDVCDDIYLKLAAFANYGFPVHSPTDRCRVASVVATTRRMTGGGERGSGLGTNLATRSMDQATTSAVTIQRLGSRRRERSRYPSGPRWTKLAIRRASTAASAIENRMLTVRPIDPVRGTK